MRALRDLRGVLAGEGEEESRLRLGVLGVGGGEREEKQLPVVMLGLLVRREEARVRRRLGVWKVSVWLGLEWEEGGGGGGEEKDEGEVGDELAGAEMRVGRESLTGIAQRLGSMFLNVETVSSRSLFLKFFLAQSKEESEKELTIFLLKLWALIVPKSSEILAR